MKKWYDEEFQWRIEVIGYLRGSGPERVCRNGEEVGDVYTCTYGCPVNAEGQGICSKVMMVLFPVMEAVRSGAIQPSRHESYLRLYEELKPLQEWQERKK